MSWKCAWWLAIGGLAVGAATDAAVAADPTGVWLREETRASHVQIAPCGDALCGTIVWLRDRNGPARIGERVLYDMRPSGEGRWSGQAYDPENGKTYSGTMTLSGPRLITSGCVLGGLICKSLFWSRVR